MYKNGLHFPIFYVFINDDFKFKDLNDILFRKSNFIVNSEERTNISIIEFINQNNGYEIYPFLLNNFDYLIQTNFKLSRENVTSKFVKKTEFISLINTFKIDFLSINSSLAKLDEIGLINIPLFLSKLYLLLYKRFAIKLGELISYSDSEGSDLFFDFVLDYKLFVNYSSELDKYRPNLIRNYDYKKNYVSSFFKSFNSNEIDDIINKIEVIKNHTDKEINSTFKGLIKEIFIVNEGVNPKTRNKCFKPLFREINSALNGKIYSEHNQESLTKEVKRFFSTM